MNELKAYLEIEYGYLGRGAIYIIITLSGIVAHFAG